MLGASVLPTERIAHVGARELAALRAAYVGSESKMRRTRIEHMSAGLPLKADIARRGWDGRKVPFAHICRHSNSSGRHNPRSHELSQMIKKKLYNRTQGAVLHSHDGDRIIM
jgi:hypothetical protein